MTAGKSTGDGLGLWCRRPIRTGSGHGRPGRRQVWLSPSPSAPPTPRSAALARPFEEKGIEVVIPPDLPAVRGDRLRLIQVLQNLMENAVKFMGDPADPRIEIGARVTREEVVCHVADNGIGIEPRHHDKIFGLFDKVDSRGTGTGVGLALVKRIIDVHGGRVWVQSAGSGLGSSFFFTLPKPDKGLKKDA